MKEMTKRQEVTERRALRKNQVERQGTRISPYDATKPPASNMVNLPRDPSPLAPLWVATSAPAQGKGCTAPDPSFPRPSGSDNHSTKTLTIR